VNRIKLMLAGAWNIRPAATHAVRAVADVHIESYRSAYRGIFPDALLGRVYTIKTIEW
jgi:hypothetical protein